MEPKDEKQKEVEKILSSHGIKMYVYGCGCCGSPNVKFEYNGIVILEDEGVSINNFDE